MAGASYEETVADAVRIDGRRRARSASLLAVGLGYLVARTIRRSLARLQAPSAGWPPAT